jgi:hypothetical protein
MRSKLMFSLCAVALAVLVHGQRLPASPVHGISRAAADCCTLADREICAKFHEISECVGGTCECSPP